MVRLPFTGLLMGCSRDFWIGNIQKIFKIAGVDSFTWSQIMKTYPEISKSTLSRLKCSGYIFKDKKPIMINGKPKIPKIVRWRLHPEAIAICKNGNNKPKINKIVKKVCKCETKISHKK